MILSLKFRTAVIPLYLFLISLVIIFSGFANAAENTQRPIPAWGEEQIAEAYNRYLDWKGDDLTFLFPIVTDVHSETTREGTLNSDPAEPDWSDSKNHIYIAQAAAIRFNADLLADLGDIGLDRYDNYEQSSPEDLCWRVAAQLRIYQDFNQIPVLFMIGNHDHGNDSAPFSNRMFGETFNGMTLRRGFSLVTDSDLDYGFLDFPEKKVRFFFLNSSDEQYYGFSKKQLQFLADHLQMPEAWTAVICQHFCVDRSIGLWKSAAHIKAFRGEVWCEILRSFVRGDKGEADGIKWDFTENKECRLAGAFTGDSHYDNQGNTGGINYIISQGFGDVLDSNMPDGAVHTRFDLTKETLIDVVAVKPAKRELKIFRIGAGGAARDRSLTF